MDPETDHIIDALLKSEGGASNDPKDGGGRTEFGISEKANPDAWLDDTVTVSEAREIYFRKYVVGPGFYQIQNLTLKHQLVDFGVNSGPAIAIRNLQTILGVEVDGELGPKTLSALNGADTRLVNNSLVGARVLLLSKICVNNPSQLKFLVGWVKRALEFLC